jgi:hypothetical protein
MTTTEIRAFVGFIGYGETRNRTGDTTPARVRMRVLIDGPGFYGSVVQLEPLARRSPFPAWVG